MAKKIVIVDDEPVTKMDIKELLEEAGYDVVGQASNGFEAINESKTHKPDLVIMDIKMPMLDGLKASKKIMHDHIAGGILLLTAFYDKEFINQAKEIGALGYLVKPLDEKSFIPTVEMRSEEHTSELQSRGHLVCRLLPEKRKKKERQR